VGGGERRRGPILKKRRRKEKSQGEKKKLFNPNERKKKSYFSLRSLKGGKGGKLLKEKPFLVHIMRGGEKESQPLPIP